MRAVAVIAVLSMFVVDAIRAQAVVVSSSDTVSAIVRIDTIGSIDTLDSSQSEPTSSVLYDPLTDPILKIGLEGRVTIEIFDSKGVLLTTYHDVIGSLDLAPLFLSPGYYTAYIVASDKSEYLPFAILE